MVQAGLYKDIDKPAGDGVRRLQGTPEIPVVSMSGGTGTDQTRLKGRRIRSPCRPDARFKVASDCAWNHQEEHGIST
jgi:hypothetical protein